MSTQTKRFRLDLAFEGSTFAGWQFQSNKLSLQQCIEDVLFEITREKIRLYGASRTDAGVHARHYVAHFDSQTRMTPSKILSGLNGLLPETVAVLNVKEVQSDFHARKNALLKTYRYFILNCPVRDPFLEKRAWHIADELDVSAMAKAAKLLEGEHDFAAFQGMDLKPRPTLKTLNTCSISVNNLSVKPPLAPLGREIWIELQSKGFLKYMVRNIVGTIVEVGRSKRQPDNMVKLLEARDRKLAGPTAPPDGLYLWEIIY